MPDAYPFTTNNLLLAFELSDSVHLVSAAYRERHLILQALVRHESFTKSQMTGDMIAEDRSRDLHFL